MAFVVCENVHETATTPATAQTNNPYELQGAAVADADTFTAQTSDTNLVFYCARDNNDWETGIGEMHNSRTRILRAGDTRITASPSSRVRVLGSSNGGSPVAWPTDASTRDITCGLPGQAIEDLLNPEDQGTGIIVRDNDYTFVNRNMVTSTPNGHITWNNASGVSGNPQIDDSILDTVFPRRDAGAGSDTINATWTYSPSTFYWSYLATPTGDLLFKGSTGNDEWLVVQKDGTRDFILYSYLDGTTKSEILTAGRGLPIFSSSTSVDNTTTGIPTMQSDSTLSVAIPSYGTWDIEYHAAVLWAADGTTTSASADCRYDIEEKIGAGGFSAVSRFDGSDNRTSGTSGSEHVIPGFYTRESATASTTYQYRVTFDNRGSGIVLNGNAGNNRYHRFLLKAHRTG